MAKRVVSIKTNKLKGRNDIRIDQLMNININDPSSKNIIAFQLMLDSNILSCYIKDNLDKDLFTQTELNKYYDFVDYIIDNFSEEGIRINGRLDKFLTGLVRKAEIQRLFRMIDPYTCEIKDSYLFIKRLGRLSSIVNETDAKDLSYFIFFNFKNKENLYDLQKVIDNPNLVNLVEYLINSNLMKSKNEKVIKNWLIFLNNSINDIKGKNNYRLKVSLENLIHRYNSIQNAKEFLGYEKDGI